APRRGGAGSRGAVGARGAAGKRPTNERGAVGARGAAGKRPTNERGAAGKRSTNERGAVGTRGGALRPTRERGAANWPSSGKPVRARGDSDHAERSVARTTGRARPMRSSVATSSGERRGPGDPKAHTGPRTRDAEVSR